MHNLILASGSNYKQQLLKRLGISFIACAPEVDESPRSNETPPQIAQRLAADKASAIASNFPDKYVLGADQVIALGDTIFSKPGTVDKACQQLRLLSGTTHRLHTALCLHTPRGTTLYDVITYEMSMRQLTDAEIRQYVIEDRPLDCAGSYKIEAAGIRLFTAMRGDDYTAIIGLPLTRVWHLLEEAGFFNSIVGSPPKKS